MKKLLPSLILLVLLIGSVFIVQKYINQPDIPKLYSVPPFEFQSQRDVLFTNENFKNKISVVDFIFTNCPGICPLMSREMTRLYNDFKYNEHIQFVSFSVDPARDSLSVLKSYAKSWGANDQRWYFLRTEQETIQQLYEQGFKLGGELPFSHSTKFVLVDNNNMIRGYYTFDQEEELEQLKKDLTYLADDI